MQLTTTQRKWLVVAYGVVIVFGFAAPHATMLSWIAVGFAIREVFALLSE